MAKWMYEHDGRPGVSGPFIELGELAHIRVVPVLSDNHRVARIGLDLKRPEQPNSALADNPFDLVVGPGMRVLGEAHAVQPEPRRLFDELFWSKTAVPAAAGCMYVEI